MNIIYLNENDLNKFIKISDDSFESVVYLYKNKIFKVFKTKNDKYNCAQYEKNDLENKRNKLILLNQMNLDSRFVTAKELIYINNEFRGYTMDFISFNTLDDFLFKNRKLKIYLLQQIKSIIESAHKNDLILGDINSRNFFIRNNYIYIGDLDNCTINEYKTDSLNMSIVKEYLNFQPIDKNFDIFMFNILAIHLITKISPACVLTPFCIENTIFGKNKKLWNFYINFLKFYNSNYKVENVLDVMEKEKIQFFTLF